MYVLETTIANRHGKFSIYLLKKYKSLTWALKALDALASHIPDGVSFQLWNGDRLVADCTRWGVKKYD